ncbi:large conductance mechanosensitive channel protein MscL [uncultured Megasphaera sp.]|uniref:large conductance mechanosensitive channel protein MscL n=1 Tax=uncultured Megasphaera sp. TaxID=165188 RepID=UPI0025834464|nr:large conductance mechanosensitive channel protein MscL [uncultured Megasphaera sp.]
MHICNFYLSIYLQQAFGKIVTSLVNNIIMPPFGVLLGGIDFSDFFIPLSTEHVESLAEAKTAGIPVIAYGAFLNTVLEFLIIAFAIFIVIKQLNRFFPKPEPAPEPRLCPFCRQPIADDATRCPHCTSELPATVSEK